MDFIDFFGRLHPLLVHLPIGFLIIVVLLEWWSRGKNESEGRYKAIVFILFCGVLSAIAAALFGWLLADGGGYDENTLFWHRWLGISTAVLSLIAWQTKRKKKNQIYKYSVWGIALFLLGSGHFGGSLTHGSDYLLLPLLGETGEIVQELPSVPDSIQVYKHIVRPALEQKCYGCHNSEKKQGGLDMTTWEDFIAGGEHGPVIERSIWESELFRRITLPQENKKFMPPKGNPLTYDEISIIKWWLTQGADPENSILQLKMTEEIQEILINSYKIDPRPKSFVERVQIGTVDERIFSKLESLGWKVRALSVDNNFLEVSPIPSNSLPKPDLEELLQIKENVTWLNLGKSNLSDADIGQIGQFINLSRLRLENNSISDVGLKSLSGLKNLESLNLYNNPLTDAGLEYFDQFPALKRIYLWKTGITLEGINRLGKVILIGKSIMDNSGHCVMQKHIPKICKLNLRSNSGYKVS